MRIVADLHVHSKYSRATSRYLEIEVLEKWAERKGVNVMGTGDFTHPLYLASLKKHLVEAEAGVYRLEKSRSPVRFLFSSEVNVVFKDGGKGHRIHMLLYAPTWKDVEAINKRLSRFGDLKEDGRPTLLLSARQLVAEVLDAAPDAWIVPAHAWTPWFSVFGSHSGYDSLEECFGDALPHIRALETGLSSDPEMNHRVSALDRFSLVSYSDAHSPQRIGREASVLESDINYRSIVEGLCSKDPRKFLMTIEFYPEEGKYHYDGHRKCGVRLTPEETRRLNGRCPVCKKKVTIGVMSRVEALADRRKGFVPPGAVPSRHLVPLDEIVAAALGRKPASVVVARLVDQIIQKGGNELQVLMDLPPKELSLIAPPEVARGILSVREGRLSIAPGYDGLYGEIDLLQEKAAALF
jgi:uncharacterized protein (TIGR00375 family)